MERRFINWNKDILWAGVFALLTAMCCVSCSGNAKNKGAVREASANDIACEVYLDMDDRKIDSLCVVFPHVTMKKFLAGTDRLSFFKWITSSTYDSTYNSHGQRKNVDTFPADYTIELTYRTVNDNIKEYILIWKEEDKLRHGAVWYNLNHDRKNEIYALLDNYK